jgi:transposase-like protein
MERDAPDECLSDLGHPICCNTETERIGVNERGEYKYYCNICHDVLVVSKGGMDERTI